MNARRCTMCAINWPCTSEYHQCPACGCSTNPLSSATPLSADEAASRKRHAEFERFYTEREAKRSARAGYVAPEDDTSLDPVPPEVDWDREIDALLTEHEPCVFPDCGCQTMGGFCPNGGERNNVT